MDFTVFSLTIAHFARPVSAIIGVDGLLGRMQNALGFEQEPAACYSETESVLLPL